VSGGKWEKSITQMQISEKQAQMSLLPERLYDGMGIKES